MRKSLCILMLLAGIMSACQSKPATESDEIKATMKKATQYMMDVVSYQGGFVWCYLPDFSRTWGELEAKRTMVWIQPPGTPSVGHLMLDALHATGDEFYYEQACRVADALIKGQLPCGGWNYMFDFAGEESLKEWYATIGKQGWRLEEFQHYYGNATFDDGGTMEAAKFMLRMYMEKKDKRYGDCLEKCINFVLESQYPVGGWPQRYPLMYDHNFQGREDYSSFLTFNDDVIPENIDFLLQCHQALNRPELKDVIIKAMRMTILLQQPKPYAGWSDQYFVESMKPAHARSYEPRAVNTGTTAKMIYTSIDYYKMTGDEEFLKGIPAAIEFIESTKLSEEQQRLWEYSQPREGEILIPRFVHPETGKPQFVHRKGSNVANGMYYIDDNIQGTIAHYSSASRINVGRLKEAYNNIMAMSKEEATKDSPLLHEEKNQLSDYYYPVNMPRRGQATPVKEIMESLTAEGCWLSPLRSTTNPYKPIPGNMEPSETREYQKTMVGDEYDTSAYPPTEEIMCISTQTFIRNMCQLMQALQ